MGICDAGQGSDGDRGRAVLGALHVPGVSERLEAPDTIPTDAVAQPDIHTPDEFVHLL